jgi:hypothetical protein
MSRKKMKHIPHPSLVHNYLVVKVTSLDFCLLKLFLNLEYYLKLKTKKKHPLSFFFLELNHCFINLFNIVANCRYVFYQQCDV